MEHWQAIRAKRSRDHDIQCTQLSFSDDSLLFSMIGTLGDSYQVEISEDLGRWPPSCSCEDYMWRGGDFLCKHICYCLRLMLVEETALEEHCWEPQDQEALLEHLCNAPSVVGDKQHEDYAHK